MVRGTFLETAARAASVAQKAAQTVFSAMERAADAGFVDAKLRGQRGQILFFKVIAMQNAALLFGQFVFHDALHAPHEQLRTHARAAVAVIDDISHCGNTPVHSSVR